MFKNQNKPTKIYIRRNGMIVIEQPVRLVKLLHNDRGIKITTKDRVVNFNLELPLPQKITSLMEDTLYYNCEPTSFDKNDILLEYPDIQKDFIRINNEKFFFHSIVFSIHELNEDKGWISLTVSLNTDKNEEYTSHMNLFVNVEKLISQNKGVSSNKITRVDNKQPFDKDFKPIDELSIDDFIKYPIWEWALGEESNSNMDETWVKPSIHKEFNQDLNGSLIKGEIELQGGMKVPCVMEAMLSDSYFEVKNIVVYVPLDNKTEYEYIDLTDFLKVNTPPIRLLMNLYVNGKLTFFEKKITTKNQFYLPIRFHV